MFSFTLELLSFYKGTLSLPRVRQLGEAQAPPLQEISWLASASLSQRMRMTGRQNEISESQGKQTAQFLPIMTLCL